MNLPIVIAAAIAGTILGWLQRSNLNRLSYRYDDEVQQAAPGPRWWVIPASTLTAATPVQARVDSGEYASQGEVVRKRTSPPGRVGRPAERSRG